MTRLHRIDFRVTLEEKRIIMELARRRGLPVARLLRGLVFREVDVQLEREALLDTCFPSGRRDIG
jgi:hypothetical protein